MDIASETVERCYLRFGQKPVGGRSLAAPGGFEQGFSVLPARKRGGADGTSPEEYIIELPTRPLSVTCEWLFAENRPLFEVSGTPLPGEIGSDGEPLLEDFEVVTEVPPNTRISTDPARGIRYRDKAARDWGKRRRRGKLRSLSGSPELVGKLIQADTSERTEDLREAFQDGLDGKVLMPGPPYPHLAHLIATRRAWGASWSWVVENLDARRYVLRCGHNFGHLREREAAERCYRALGVAVPPSAIYEPESGSAEDPAHNLAVFVEGRRLWQLEELYAHALIERDLQDMVPLTPPEQYQKRITKLHRAVRESFAASALLADWDAAGFRRDEVVLGTGTKVWRVNCAGALRYRRVGVKKPPGAFGPEVGELMSMRHNRFAWARVFSELTDAEVARQIRDNILPAEDALLEAVPEELGEVMASRVCYMREWAAKTPRNKEPKNTLAKHKAKPKDSPAEAPRLLQSALEWILEHSTSKDSLVHGAGHWKRVAAAGLELLEEVPEADAASVFLFSILHDSMRGNDDHDPGHGHRGAELGATLLAPEGLPLLRGNAKSDLHLACTGHTQGEVADPAFRPTVAVCWDADRLNLWRVGMRPDPNLLCTKPAKTMIERGRALQEEDFEWEDLIERYSVKMARQNKEYITGIEQAVNLLNKQLEGA